MYPPDHTQLQCNLIDVLEQVYLDKRPCKLCGMELYFVPIKRRKKPQAFDRWGVAHELICEGLKKKG